MNYAALRASDPEIYDVVVRERDRQAGQLEMIASENFVSEAVLEAAGSVLTNKYAEGYPGRRYYGGCEVVDDAERLAIDRAKRLFGAEHVNVQPHSGSQANQSVYFAVLKPGDPILGLRLDQGGHLTHGHPKNLSGAIFRVHAYGVRRDDHRIDYDELERLAKEHRPKVIVTGASAYPRTIDFERVQRVAAEVGAVQMADIAHYAGLVAAGLYPSPVPHADFVTTTTHKTLRGPRSGLVMCRAAHAKALDSSLFPGLQGGPLMHVVAAKAVALGEALKPEFRPYQERILANARALAASLLDAGLSLVSGGTDCHLVLVDVTKKGSTGKEAEAWLEAAGITVNKNAIPFDPHPPAKAGGIRIGTPALTTRGMGEAEMARIGRWITEAIVSHGDAAVLARIKKEVSDLCAAYPLYPSLS